MINNKYLILSEDLIAEYHSVMQSSDQKKLMVFLRKYLKFIECDDAAYNRYLCLNDPLISHATNQKFMCDFNSAIGASLNLMLKHGSKMGRKGVKEGDITCYFGVAHEYGLFNMPLNPDSAFYYYTVSAQLNSDLGTFRLAQCYEKGIGTSVNTAKAVYFFRCAAKLGLPDGMHVYGTVLANGLLDCERDMELGLHFLSLASLKANRIYPYALYDVGRWYENNKNDSNILSDSNYSYEIYYKGTQLKDPNCMHRIAEAYEKGLLGRKPNADKALEFYKMAAHHGQIDAQLGLCELYFNGVGRKRRRSPQQSYFWALRAATKGSGRAAYIIGEYATKGYGMRVNNLLALWWLTISSNLGYDESVNKIIDLKQEISQKDEGPFIQNGCCNIFC